jgi:uncharacterized protein YprB with RNaseH-like and TPR domain
VDAYLDIETTGLQAGPYEITVVGIYVVDGRENRVVQLVGDEITERAILQALEGVDTIYTYNGSRFDLPFIKASIGTDLETTFDHRDLMYDCWACNLKGGLKRVEVTLGVDRELKGLDGWDAVLLWRRYARTGDKEALDKLLHYNKEDVVNLKALRDKLEEIVWERF